MELFKSKDSHMLEWPSQSTDLIPASHFETVARHINAIYPIVVSTGQICMSYFENNGSNSRIITVAHNSATKKHIEIDMLCRNSCLAIDRENKK